MYYRLHRRVQKMNNIISMMSMCFGIADSQNSEFSEKHKRLIGIAGNILEEVVSNNDNTIEDIVLASYISETEAD